MKCPDVPIPERLAHLDRDPRGYPIFWAATNPDEPGDYSFRGIYAKRALESGARKLCQLCGTPLGYWVCFSGGPKSCVNRVFSEPPMHRECLEYAYQVCPFLLRGGWDRSRTILAEHVKEADPYGDVTKPERMGIYVTRGYEMKSDGSALLFFVRPAKQIIWKDVTA